PWLPTPGIHLHTSAPSHPLFPSRPTATPTNHTPSLHDALPISGTTTKHQRATHRDIVCERACLSLGNRLPRSTIRVGLPLCTGRDRKSTRLNSSHGSISYAVFCLNKKITGYGSFPDYSRPCLSP